MTTDEPTQPDSAPPDVEALLIKGPHELNQRLRHTQRRLDGLIEELHTLTADYQWLRDHPDLLRIDELGAPLDPILTTDAVLADLKHVLAQVSTAREQVERTRGRHARRLDLTGDVMAAVARHRESLPVEDRYPGSEFHPSDGWTWPTNVAERTRWSLTTFVEVQASIATCRRQAEQLGLVAGNEQPEWREGVLRGLTIALACVVVESELSHEAQGRHLLQVERLLPPHLRVLSDEREPCPPDPAHTSSERARVAAHRANGMVGHQRHADYGNWQFYKQLLGLGPTEHIPAD
ncbi:hypothetical protein [Nocardia jejuensis]|uniref:hypothetical protein n=1 Tax=Nocardia jejuensis TaxID=328049 RepID=UPI000836C8BA|nr:hypothetical protein [Nocardia jejuensis]